MVKLFFDIETIPSADEHKDMHLDILRKKKKYQDAADDDIHKDTSLDGTYGRICCIGVIKEDQRGINFKDVMSGTEKEMLQKFWGLAAGVQQFIGHNIWGFDMPFILQRSMVNGVKPLPINFRRYMKEPLYDTMLEWTFWNFDREKNPRLDTLAKVFGLPTSKDEMDGSMVWPYFQKGRIDEICKYCMKDVELTRKVYYKMIVEQVPFEEISTPDDIQF
jgi:predicted PolB exonuclease-like 3'-5' exonuclease